MLKSATPNETQLAYRKALEAAIRAHGTTLDVTELVAITSHLVGQLVALMPVGLMTEAAALDLVFENMQQGNGEVLSNLLKSEGALQ